MNYGETVTRIRRGEQTGVDRYNKPIFETVETDIPGAGFDPGGSVEPVEVGRASVVTTPKLYFYESVPDIRRDDEIRVRGKVYQVASDPAEWRNPLTGWVAGTAVELTRGEG